jgi:hypothetical protein
MPFRIRGLAAEHFAHLFALSDAELAAHFWHLTDKPIAPIFVAYWTNNGQKSAQGLNG